MVLYKYVRKINSALRILEDLRLKVTPPNQFNDPFELTPRSKFTLTDEKMLNTLKMDAEYSTALYRMMTEGGYPYSYEQFMAEMPTVLPGKFKEFKKLSRSDLFKLDLGSLDEGSQFVGILCVSGPSNSIPMWSYYANDHKGVAIGIDPAKIGGSLPGRFGKVRYRKHRFIVDRWLKPDTEQWFNQITKTMYVKSRDWQHEQEYRWVFRLQDLLRVPGKDGKGNHFLNIDGSDIREIVFGCWTDPNDENRIRAELRRRPKTFEHVKLFRCRRHRSQFRLEVVRAA